MPVYISLLRGVNVGGHHKIRMEALRQLYAGLGFEGVQTYVQSGNAVFRAKDRNAVKVARRIEEGIETTFGFASAVVIRTAEEWRDVVRRNPFVSRNGIEPQKLAVFFLAEEPDSAARERLDSLPRGIEEIVVSGRELFIYFPNGMGQSKTPALVERALKATSTARNWNSVMRIAEIAESL